MVGLGINQRQGFWGSSIEYSGLREWWFFFFLNRDAISKSWFEGEENAFNSAIVPEIYTGGNVLKPVAMSLGLADRSDI